jgi:hypothetical protein
MNLFGMDRAMTWPEAAFLLGALLLIAFLTALVIVGVFESRKAESSATQVDDLRQLVHRFEHLAETALDAQRRAAADLAELHSRTASIEHILHTVD